MWIGKTQKHLHDKRNINQRYRKIEKEKPPTKNNKLTRINKYVAIPFNNQLFNKTKKLVKKYNLEIKLAPQPVQRNSRIIFANVKDRTDVSNMKNCVFAMKCRNCNFKVWCKTTNLDVERTIKGKYIYQDSKIRQHMENNEGHKIESKICEMKSYKNSHDLNVAFNLIANESF